MLSHRTSLFHHFQWLQLHRVLVNTSFIKTLTQYMNEPQRHTRSAALDVFEMVNVRLHWHEAAGS